MESFSIQNFKFGYDTRRGELTSQPGTLLVCENGHITPGGEVEKRKAFNIAFVGIPGIFGFDFTELGLTVFGSDDITDPIPDTTVPPLFETIRYQRLQHPFVLDGGTYDEAKHAMTDVVFSCNFSGKAFVLAKYADGKKYAFYDGDLVEQSRNGIVIEGEEAVAEQSTQLAAQIDALIPDQNQPQWNGEANTPSDGFGLMKSPPGVYFEPTKEVSSALGSLAFALKDKDSSGTSALSAVASFTVDAGNPGNITITAPETQGGSGSVTLANAIPWTTSATNTALLLVAAINATTPLYGYYANSSGAVVFVRAQASWGAVTFNLTVTTTESVTTSAGTGSDVTVSPLVVSGLRTTSVDKPIKVTSSPVTARLSGTNTADTYLWTEVSDSSGITIDNPTAATTTFSKTMGEGDVAGIFKCTVTRGGTFVTANVSVRLEHRVNHGTWERPSNR